MKKWLKIWLIIGWSLIITWCVCVWLAKIWAIHNQLGLELWCPWIGLTNVDNYDRTDPDCSIKCYKECEKYEDKPFWYLCWNGCITKCKKPKRDNCFSQCEMPDFWDESGIYYTVDDYYEWCREKYTWDCFLWLAYWNNNLNTLQYYDEWINDRFSWYQEELNMYESCKSSCGQNPGEVMVKKPIIYLYPTRETEVNVTLWTPKNLSHTYPKYNPERWRNVIAQPDGELKDTETWRKLYALYREWKAYTKDNFDEWFVVKWENIISFLEEKLAILWLNEREAEEFIVYWLPQMEKNNYNLIRFETKEEQDINMPLNIIPKPDTVIRVMMDWKVIDEPINISEQQLVTPERKWFTVVEWGWSPRS